MELTSPEPISQTPKSSNKKLWTALIILSVLVAGGRVFVEQLWRYYFYDSARTTLDWLVVVVFLIDIFYIVRGPFRKMLQAPGMKHAFIKAIIVALALVLIISIWARLTIKSLGAAIVAMWIGGIVLEAVFVIGIIAVIIIAIKELKKKREIRK